ncbi:MAG: PASTA domain-containing protein [Actinomycetota bacterium]
MADLEQQLRGYADQVESTVGPTPAVAASRNRRRRAWLGWAAALVVVAGVGVGIGFALDDDDGEAPDTRVEPPTTSTTTAAPDDGVPTTTVPFATPEAAFDAGPLSPRHDALVLRTPDEVIVWGGDVESFNIGRPDLESEQFADGAVYGLDTSGTWRTMAPSPLPAIDVQPLGVWLGSDALIVRGTDAARYDPAADEWTSIEPAPTRVWDLIDAPEIDAVFAVGREQVLRFDVGTNAWSDTGRFAPWELTEQNIIPVDPNPDPSVSWTGRELVAVAGDLLGRFPVQTWTPGGAWEARGHIESGRSQVALESTSVDGEVWVVGYDMTVHVFDPATGDVRALPHLPVLFQEGTPTIDHLDDGRIVVRRWPGVAVWTGDGWEVEPMRRAQSGTIAPGVDGQPAVWQFSVGFDAGDGNRFGVTALPRAGTLHEVLIGALALDLGTDIELVGQRLVVEDPDAGVRTPIETTIRTADGATCALAYGLVDREGWRTILFDSERELAYDCPTSVITPLVDRMRDFWADGAEPVTVPSVIGLAEEEARSALASLGYVVDVVAEPNAQTAGMVVRQDPVPGTTLALDEPVTIYVSSGSERVVVPDLEGLTLVEAAELLEELGFAIEGDPILEASVEVPEDRIVRSEPQADSLVAIGARIVLYQSAGAPTVPVPTVIGLFYDTAEATLRNVGLVPVIEFRAVPFGDPQVGLVIDQTPPNFEEVEVGTEVVVVVGEAGSEPEPLE